MGYTVFGSVRGCIAKEDAMCITTAVKGIGDKIDIEIIGASERTPALPSRIKLVAEEYNKPEKGLVGNGWRWSFIGKGPGAYVELGVGDTDGINIRIKEVHHP
jgi:hypothetical protein